VAVTFRNFSILEDLLKAMLIYPRRIKQGDKPGLLSFESDDDTEFSISLDDYKRYASDYCEGDVPFRVKVFVKAVESNKVDEWCEGINYGKPDFKEKGVQSS